MAELASYAPLQAAIRRHSAGHRLAGAIEAESAKMEELRR